MPIRVRVFRRDGRENFEAQWTDPLTGRKKTRSTGSSRRRDAERFAARLESQLNDGTFSDPVRTTWENFRKRYEADVLPALAPKTGAKTRSTFNQVEKLLGKPNLLASLDATAIGRFQRLLRAKGREEFTIKGHLAELRKTLRWAKRMGLLQNVPAIDVPKRVRGMKGRPITGEEFDRFIKAVPSIVGEEVSASWEHHARGLWLSGLRLSESLLLHWTDDRNLCVDLSGRRPMLRIRGNAEKGRKDRVLPITPDFAEFLLATPERQRRGYVFEPIPYWTAVLARPRQDAVSKVFSSIGEAAKIKVWSGREDKVKHASAHDLRRSFGFRWAQRVPAATLMLLMRHESIHTTMEFYVGRDAEAAADTIWLASANDSANTSTETNSQEPKESSQPVDVNDT